MTNSKIQVCNRPKYSAITLLNVKKKTKKLHNNQLGLHMTPEICTILDNNKKIETCYTCL